MSTKNLVVQPSCLYFPNTRQRIQNIIFIHNKEKKHFLCVNISSPNASVFRIEPSPSFIVPPETSYPVKITKVVAKHKITKAIHFYVMSKYIEDIYELPRKGWNQSRLIDLKMKVIAKKPGNDIDIFEDRGVVIFKPKEKTLTLLGSRLINFSCVSVEYGIPDNEKYNFWDLCDLYYLPDRKKLVSKLDLFEEVLTVYCPHCCQVKSKGDQGAKGRLNGRCDFCVECPLCGCNLQTIKEEGGKMYFYHCNSCNWNSTSMKTKILSDEVKGLSSEVMEIEKHSKKLKEFGEIEKNMRKMFDEFIDREDVKKMSRLELNARMPPFSVSSGSFLNVQKKKKITHKVERNTVSVSNLVKNADPVAKLFAEKTFNYSKILSSGERRRNPQFSSIIKRELAPFRKKLLSKKQKKYVLDREELNHMLVVNPDSQDTLNSLESFPNLNAFRTMPRVSVLYFDKFISGEETPLDLRITNPNTSAMKVVLLQERNRLGILETVVNLPPVEFKILGIEKNREIFKKQEDDERLLDKKSENAMFLGVRRENTLVIKAGVTISNPMADTDFTLRAKITFDVTGISHSTEILIHINLGRDVRK